MFTIVGSTPAVVSTLESHYFVIGDPATSERNLNEAGPDPANSSIGMTKAVFAKAFARTIFGEKLMPAERRELAS
jgi:hypothetical protein